MSFKRYGARPDRGIDEQNNVRQAKHLYSLVEKHPDFEAAASEPPLSGDLYSFSRRGSWMRRYPRKTACEGLPGE